MILLSHSSHCEMFGVEQLKEDHSNAGVASESSTSVHDLGGSVVSNRI